MTATEGFVVPIKQLERTKVSAEDHVAQVRDLEAQITRLQEALTRAQAQVRDHEDSLAQVRALASKLAQQEKLTAEKAYVDQEALSRYVERATYDKEVTDLQDRDSQMASAIGELSGELRRLKDTVDSLVTLEKMRREVVRILSMEEGSDDGCYVMSTMFTLLAVFFYIFPHSPTHPFLITSSRFHSQLAGGGQPQGDRAVGYNRELVDGPRKRRGAKEGPALPPRGSRKAGPRRRHGPQRPRQEGAPTLREGRNGLCL